jgi:hypothetical protein
VKRGEKTPSFRGAKNMPTFSIYFADVADLFWRMKIWFGG